VNTEYVGGLYAKKPLPKAPSYIIVNLSAKREKLIEFLKSKQDEWVNMVVKEGNQGYYIAVDNWKPTKDKASEQEKNQAELNSFDIKQPEKSYIPDIPYPEEDINPEDIPF
jgi:hypothetical protein